VSGYKAHTDDIVTIDGEDGLWLVMDIDNWPSLSLREIAIVDGTALMMSLIESVREVDRSLVSWNGLTLDRSR